jgi:hypothetical protein
MKFLQWAAVVLVSALVVVFAAPALATSPAQSQYENFRGIPHGGDDEDSLSGDDADKAASAGGGANSIDIDIYLWTSALIASGGLLAAGGSAAMLRARRSRPAN